MDAMTLSLKIGLVLGLLLTIWQAIRIFTGANPVIMRNEDGSVYRAVATLTLFFILWAVVSVAVAFIVISLIKLIT